MHQREYVGSASVGVLGKLLLAVWILDVELAVFVPPRRTRGIRLQRPRSPARSLYQLKYVMIDTDNKHR